MADKEAELEVRIPEIPWRDPLPISTPLASGLACRFCVAFYGLHARDVSELPQTEEDFATHMAAFH